MMCSENKKEEKSHDKQNIPLRRIICWSLIGVFVLWALTFFLFFISESENRGQFGDMFGAVNALFSGLAFAGLIITLILQRQELSLQREELEQTKDELKNQRVEFEKENETLRYQRFENLFYNMLNLQQEIVSGLRYDYEEEALLPLTNASNYPTQRETRRVRQTVVGRDVFRFAFEEVDLGLSIRNNLVQTVYKEGYRLYLRKKGISAYDDTWVPTRFDHYFRHLYKIVQFVDSQGFPFDEAYRYVSLLRGTLSRYELVWIYYNALNPPFAKFKKLIEKYTLLKSLREDLLTTCYETEQYYKGMGLTIEKVKKGGFSASDFEFFLTDSVKEDKKYHISAFWKKEEFQQGQEHLNSWRNYIDKAVEKVEE